MAAGEGVLPEASEESLAEQRKSIILGVTGGIAAYKSAYLARLLGERYRVTVVMTEAACRFVQPLTFRAITHSPVLSDMFHREWGGGIAHIETSEGADLIVVAPATADFIARIATGRANDLLSAIVLASRCPVLLAPGMNTLMWENPMTADNVRRLLTFDRFHFVGPESGKLACGVEGTGRMAEPAEILRFVEGILLAGGRRDLVGRRVLVTAGPTVEEIDPVRFVSNRSSGRMGYAIARAAQVRGAATFLVSGPVSLDPPAGMEVVRVRSAAQMHQAVMERLAGADVLLMAAAVADWKPPHPPDEKIKKEEVGERLTLEMVRTPDILAECAAARKGRLPLIVGFALETNAASLLQSAAFKLEQKGCDLMVGNLAQSSLGGETAQVSVVDRTGKTIFVKEATKDEVAHRLLDIVAEKLSGDCD